MKNPFLELTRGRVVGFFGIGRSNLALLAMLAGTGVPVILRSDKEIRREILPEGLNLVGIFEGDAAARDIREDLLIFSPSVRRDRAEFLAAKQRGCVFTSDFEIFLRYNEKPIFLVTGSDGKSTTTTLTSAMLGADFPAIGNLGVPMTEALNMDARGYVIEASSFMLEYARPAARRAVLTSLSENHLDWHGSFEDYKAAKIGAIKEAREAVISADSPAIFDAFSGKKMYAKKMHGEGKEMYAKKMHDEGKEIFAVCSKNFSEDELKRSFRAKVYYSISGGYIVRNGERIFRLSEAYRREDFNIKNYMNALALTDGFADEERRRELIRGFRGLAHRCEIFAEIGGVKFINSSIDTSPERTISTLQSLPRGLIILLGGRDKNLSFAPLAALISARGDLPIIYGEAREKISQAFGGYPHICREFFREAVEIAKKNAKPGATVLLSPAAASYDEFSSFEERGNSFKSLILGHI